MTDVPDHALDTADRALHYAEPVGEEVERLEPWGYDNMSAFMRDDPYGDYMRVDQHQRIVEGLKEQAKPVQQQGTVVGWYQPDAPFHITANPSICANWHREGLQVAAVFASPPPAVAQSEPVGEEVQRLQAELERLQAHDSFTDLIGWTVKVEKALCEKLGKQWTADGISIQSLIDELAVERDTLHKQLDEARVEAAGIAGRCDALSIKLDEARDFFLKVQFYSQDEIYAKAKAWLEANK